MILLLAACSSRTNVRDGDDYIYCLNPDKTGLVKVSYEVQGGGCSRRGERHFEGNAEAGRRDPVYTGYFQKIKVQDCKLREVSWMLISIANTDR